MTLSRMRHLAAQLPGVVGLLGLLLATPLRAQPAPAGGETIGIGMVPGTDFVPALIAKDKGYFAAHGMNASVTILPLISNIPAAIISGSLRFGATTGPVFLQAVENGIDLVAIAGASRWTRDAQTVSIVVANDSGITKPADLVGRKVAVPGLNSLIDLSFRRWLLLKGVDPTRVTELEASFPAMGDLLRNHQVDAALVIEPFRDFALTSKAGTRMSDYASEISPDILAAFWIADRKWAVAHPEMVAAFRAGIQQGIDIFLHDPEGKLIEAKYLRVNAKVTPAFDTNITPADLAFHQDLAQQFKMLDSKVDPASLILK
jgi:NitT/TauT family transport system substrate-binding protein